MEVLLTSEKFIKSVSSISDNLGGKYLLPSIREAQEIGLKSILGEVLLDRLKSLVSSGQIDTNADYKTLLDKCQYYLAYYTIVEVTNKVSFKVANSGVQKTTDENMQLATMDEIAKTQYYYQSKVDASCYELQNYLLENQSKFPELSRSVCHKIQSNLISSASCGIFLGGRRGKKQRRDR